MSSTKNSRAPRQLTLLDFCPQLAKPSQNWEELVDKIEEEIVEKIAPKVKVSETAPATKPLRSRRKRTATKGRKVEQQKQKKGWNTVKPSTKKAKKATPTPKPSPAPKPSPTKTNESPRRVHVNTTLILKNLPYEGTYNSDLREIFEKYGAIQFVNVLRDEDKWCTGIAFIRYETKEGSDNALADMDHFLYNDRRVRIEYARDRRN